MRYVFGDTSYFIALVNDLDVLHDRARSLSNEFAATAGKIVTTLSVLEEFLTEWSRRDQGAKLKAAEFVDRVRRSPTVEVLPITDQLFDVAIDLYRRRMDKQYSMVDCTSMVICEQRSITEVLTADHDFEQEGMIALMR